MIQYTCDFCKLPSRYRMGQVVLKPFWQPNLGIHQVFDISKDICKDCAKTLELDDTQ